MDMEADLVHVLEPLAGKLKRALQKKGSNFKDLDLDEMQSKRLGALVIAATMNARQIVPILSS